MRKGKNLMVHCMGGLGRAPTFAATCLIYAGLSSEEAIKLVQKGRPDSLTLACQRNFLHELKFDWFSSHYLYDQLLFIKQWMKVV